MRQSRRPQMLDKPQSPPGAKQVPTKRRTARQTLQYSTTPPRHLPTGNLAARGGGQVLGSPTILWRTLCPSMRQHMLVQIVAHSLVAHGATQQPCNRNQSVRTALQQAVLLG